MKRLIVMLVGLFCVSTTSFAADKSKSKGRETVVFHVNQVNCGNCIKKIEKNIAFERGVTDLTCSLEDRTATVTFRTDRTSKAKLVDAFKKLGFSAVYEEAESEADADKK
jgi:Copper chaperone